MPLQRANEVELYYELRSAGPPVLLMMGASGYGGVFRRFAELLADEFTVVTYDRRGNGQSPKPAGWTATSPQEQADDAAALLAGLDLAPAAIFATSSAGIFALAALIGVILGGGCEPRNVGLETGIVLGRWSLKHVVVDRHRVAAAVGRAAGEEVTVRSCRSGGACPFRPSPRSLL